MINAVFEKTAVENFGDSEKMLVTLELLVLLNIFRMLEILVLFVML